MKARTESMTSNGRNNARAAYVTSSTGVVTLHWHVQDASPVVRSRAIIYELRANPRDRRNRLASKNCAMSFEKLILKILAWLLFTAI